MTVFVVQQPRPNKNNWVPDLSSAAEYGPLEYVFDSHEKVFALPGPSLFKAAKLMRDKFNFEKDYILWPSAGDPMAFAALMLAFKDLNIDYIHFLIWDRKRDATGQRDPRNGFYVPVKFVLKKEKSDVDT